MSKYLLNFPQKLYFDFVFINNSYFHIYQDVKSQLIPSSIVSRLTTLMKNQSINHPIVLINFLQ